MEQNNIFTVTITGANHEVREFISDCVIVLAHNDEADDSFNMSLNISSKNKVTLMLLEAMDQAKQQILNSDPELKVMYEKLQCYKADIGEE